MKPTFKIALIRSPNHGARLWLKNLTQHNEQDSWRASFETEVNRYDFTVGMPPLSHPHAAIVLVDVKEGVTELLKRNLWHAKRRGIYDWFALLHNETNDEDLFDIASFELRECFQSVGLNGNALSIFTATPEDNQIKALYELLDSQLVYRQQEIFAQPEAQYRLARLVKRLFFYEIGASDLWQGALWSYFCRGEDAEVEADRLWKLHSILYQACCGYFDDVPDLLALLEGLRPYLDAIYFRVASEFLGYVGTRELLPLVKDFFAKERGYSFPKDALLFYAIRHWNYLSCVPVLRSLNDSKARELINENIWQILGGRAWEDVPTLNNKIRAQFSEHQLLFFGRPFHMVEVAKKLLPKNMEGSDEQSLSNLFMAQTGQLYDDRELNIFLQNRTHLFQPEKRYFNSHEIPDFSSSYWQGK